MEDHLLAVSGVVMLRPCFSLIPEIPQRLVTLNGGALAGGVVMGENHLTHSTQQLRDGKPLGGGRRRGDHGGVLAETGSRPVGRNDGDAGQYPEMWTKLGVEVKPW